MNRLIRFVYLKEKDSTFAQLSSDIFKRELQPEFVQVSWWCIWCSRNTVEDSKVSFTSRYRWKEIDFSRIWPDWPAHYAPFTKWVGRFGSNIPISVRDRCFYLVEAASPMRSLIQRLLIFSWLRRTRSACVIWNHCTEFGSESFDHKLWFKFPKPSV